MENICILCEFIQVISKEIYGFAIPKWKYTNGSLSSKNEGLSRKK